MTFSVRHDPEHHVIIAEIKGEVTLHDFQAIAAEIMRVVKEKNCLYVLTDLRGVSLEKLSVADIYFLPQTLSEIAIEQGIELRSARRAFVAQEDHQLLRFYETVSRNRGIDTRLFFDFEEAQIWLLNGNQAGIRPENSG